MITHKTYKTEKNEWVMPREVVIKDGKILREKTKEILLEGPCEKMSKSKKNVIEPDEILSSYGIDATRIFMISDSPPDRELEWTDQGIQSSKNLINRIERYFSQKKKIDNIISAEKEVEKFIYNIEKNILNFSLNKCVADIYTLFNYLEKERVYLSDSNLGHRVLTCLYPIIPKLTESLQFSLFKENNLDKWPSAKVELLVEEQINLPIQINGKFVTTFETNTGYIEKEITNTIYQLDKIKSKIENKKIIKIINVQDKIINIITN